MLCLLLPLSLTHAGAERLFVVTTLYSTSVERDVGRGNRHTEQEIVIIQLDLRD
jgi:hypothetical protein